MRRTSAIILAMGMLVGAVASILPTNPVAADPGEDLPGCSVTAGNPAVTVSGLAASGFATGQIACTDPNPMLVIGSSITASPGTSFANGASCLDCGGHSVEAGPAIALSVAHCFISKAAGSAVGVGLVVPPFHAAKPYCQVLQSPPS